MEKADYYVMALGQDAMAKGAVGHLLAAGQLSGDDFEPIYDVNQRFSDKPWRRFLGFQSKGATADSGIKILGAAVDSLARARRGRDLAFAVSHNYVQRHGDQMTLEAIAEAEDFLAQPEATMAALHAQVSASPVMDDSSRLGTVGAVATPAQLGGARAAIAAVAGWALRALASIRASMIAYRLRYISPHSIQD